MKMAAPRSNVCFMVVLMVLGCLVSCQKEQAPVATSATAQAYADEVLNLMQQKSINRKVIDWAGFRQTVNAKLQGAQTVVDTYPAIQLALSLLGDNHSAYVTADGRLIQGVRTITCSDGAPAPVPADPKIGYINVPAFTDRGNEGTAFAQSIQNSIRQADSDSIRGWVVDLRGNTGGTFWPMLAGIGPILGEGVAGYFIDPDGGLYAWSYQNGVTMQQQQPFTKVESPYKLLKANPKVAVLTNAATASSGEGIAISFKGRANTRSFGTPTCGVSTGNSGILLSDGASLTLTQVTMADRTKTAYGKSVLPDEAAYSSVAVDRAVAWLLQ